MTVRIAAATGIAALALLGLAAASDGTEGWEVTREPGTVQGAIVRLFKREQLVELKVERVIEEKEKVRADEAKETRYPVRAGQVIFVHLRGARVFDAKGTELNRHDKDAWFTKDKAWKELDEGMRCRVTYSGTHEMPPPRGFPDAARAGGNLVVYHATEVHLINAVAD